MGHAATREAASGGALGTGICRRRRRYLFCRARRSGFRRDGIRLVCDVDRSRGNGVLEPLLFFMDRYLGEVDEHFLTQRR